MEMYLWLCWCFRLSHAIFNLDGWLGLLFVRATNGLEGHVEYTRSTNSTYNIERKREYSVFVVGHRDKNIMLDVT